MTICVVIGLQCVIVVFPDHTHFFVFDQPLHQTTRLENLVQLFNAESRTIGIKPERRIDDVIQSTFLTNLSKEMYMSPIILTQNDSYNFHAIILLCQKQQWIANHSHYIAQR